MPSDRQSGPARFALLRRCVVALAVGALVAGGGYYYAKEREKQRLLALLETPLPASHEFGIERGMAMSAIAAAVAAPPFPASARDFTRLATRLGVDSSLQAGRYRFAAGDTVKEVILAIAAGDVRVEKITFIEGLRFADMRRQLEGDARLRSELKRLSDDDLRRTLSIEAESLEGMFLPETYFFTPGDSDLSVLKRSRARMEETLASLWEARSELEVLASPYEALILASIVEKETGKAAERPLIASVFTNRLKKRMRLQADPTVIYGLGERFDGNITRAHLREKTPYNTYVIKGMPPTPIALPSAAAISAVLNPAHSDYVYFVATGDGGHYFSKTLREHNNAVNRYQRRRKSK